MAETIRMRTFLLRKNCEYTKEVQALTEEDALAAPENADLSTFSQAWAPDEIEEYAAPLGIPPGTPMGRHVTQLDTGEIYDDRGPKRTP